MQLNQMNIANSQQRRSSAGRWTSLGLGQMTPIVKVLKKIPDPDPGLIDIVNEKKKLRK